MIDPAEALETVAGSLAGRPEAQRRLMELVYDDLRELAAAYIAREPAGHTLQPTALVHEAWLRLAGQERADLRERTHFYAVAATTMRRVLVDHARSRNAWKRGSGRRADGVATERHGSWEDPANLLELDEALSKLAGAHPRQARVVELRFFGGLGLEEIAETLGISRDTAKLDWRFARAWLSDKLA